MFNSRRLMPILNALLAFEEAARCNSFTRAGKSLGMAQPSVSRFIGNLEHHLGVRLFKRHHNRLQLTKQGEKLYQAVSSGLGEIREACGEVTSSATTPVLTVECTHGFAYMWLLPRIQSLMALLPGWKLRTISSDHGTQLSTSEADLVVRLGAGNWEREESLLLFEEEIFPLCSPLFARTHGLERELVSPADLSNLPLIFEDFGDHGWMAWHDWFAHFGVDYRYPEDAHPVSNYALVLQAAMEGKGLALAWQQLAEPYLGSGWLVEVPGLRVATENGYYLCFSPTSHIASLIRDWVAGIYDQAAH